MNASASPTPSADSGSWRDLPRAVRRMYSSPDTESARLRGAHLHEVVRLTPHTMLANAGGAALMLMVFSPNVSLGMWLWAGVMLCVACLALVNWRQRLLNPRQTASPRGVHRATAHSMILAGLWGTFAMIWFGSASPGQQLTVATLITGMMGAGSFVLSPLPLASLAYVAVFAVSALVALWRAHDPSLLGVAMLLILYAQMVAFGALAAWLKSTALLRAQTQSARQERLLAVLLQDFEQQAGEAFWEVGVDGVLRHESQRLRELLAVPADAPEELSLLPLVQRQSAEAADSLRQAMDTGRPFRDLQVPWGQGARTRYLSFSGKRLFDEAGQTLGWRGVLADVSEKVHSERLMRRLAHSDSLTGLSNRFVLRDALAQALRQQQAMALLSIDLDHFKAVNDSHGHSTGDELLRTVAQRLLSCVRPGDLVARLGGDEFAVLVLDPEARHVAAALAERVISALSEPIDISGRRLRVGASVGVALHEGGSGSADIGVDEVLVHADLALYAAKGGGRGCHVVYDARLGEQSHRRLAIEDGLRKALREGHLKLHWQAQVDIGTWRLTGAEALMRWTDATLGRVNPGEFIVVAEQCGLIDELGRWALLEACRAGADLLPDLTVSVNVSPLQLRSGLFVQDVRQALRETGLAPARLELEITESVFIDDAQAALEQLHALHSLGVRVALDDFGTGYSSLSYLRRFPFDTLKIDRSFVNEVLLHKDARAIVQMIANLASTLGMRTVCEGVETAEQLRSIAEAGCNEVQGYLISEPKPLAELRDLQLNWRAQPPDSRSVAFH